LICIDVGITYDDTALCFRDDKQEEPLPGGAAFDLDARIPVLHSLEKGLQIVRGAGRQEKMLCGSFLNYSLCRVDSLSLPNALIRVPHGNVDIISTHKMAGEIE
jgi:hypothetical protein